MNGTFDSEVNAPRPMLLNLLEAGDRSELSADSSMGRAPAQHLRGHRSRSAAYASGRIHKHEALLDENSLMHRRLSVVRRTDQF